MIIINTEYIYFPDKEIITQNIEENNPIILLIKFDLSEVIIGTLDDNMEHHILLANMGRSSLDIDKYFRIIVDKESADWTFVCPPQYKNISDKQKRTSAFYKDGFQIISTVLEQLGYIVGLNIPKRYTRHLINHQ